MPKSRARVAGAGRPGREGEEGTEDIRYTTHILILLTGFPVKGATPWISYSPRMHRARSPAKALSSLHDFPLPCLRGAVARVTGADVLPAEVEHRRDLDTLADMLSYLRDLRLAAENPDKRGRYTSQPRRTPSGRTVGEAEE